MYLLRIKAAFGHRRLDQISRHQIQTFRPGLTEEGLAPQPCDCTSWSFAIRSTRPRVGHAGRRPILPARIPLPPLDNKVEHLLSDAQLQCLLDVLRSG